MFFTLHSVSIGMGLSKNNLLAVAAWLKYVATTIALGVFASKTSITVIRCLLSSLLVAILLNSPSLCQSPAEEAVQKAIAQFEQSPLQSSTLDDGIYMFSGDGGNVVAVTDSGSTLLIDSGIRSRTTELIDAIFTITHRPVTRLINTHWHFDHTGGNPFFGSAGVTIVAQENVKVRLSSGENVAFVNFHDGPYPAMALPSQTYTDQLVIQQGSEQLRLLHLKAAHTDGDTVVFIDSANIVVMGGIFSHPFYPIIDLNSGGSLQGIIDSVNQVLAASNEETRYVPGHGPIATRADLQAYRSMLITLQDRITLMVSAGKTMDQVVATNPTADFDAKWGTSYVNGMVFTEMAYTSIAGKQLEGIAKEKHKCF